MEMSDDVGPMYLRRLNEALQSVASARYVAPDADAEHLEEMESDIEAMMETVADELDLSEEELDLVRMSIYDSLGGQSE